MSRMYVIQVSDYKFNLRYFNVFKRNCKMEVPSLSVITRQFADTSEKTLTPKCRSEFREKSNKVSEELTESDDEW